MIVGFDDVDLFSKYKAPEVNFRDVDDTFCLFGSETEDGEFFSHLNNMRTAFLLRRRIILLLFLDVLMCKETSVFLTTVYRKPNFTGLYIQWDSFCPQKRKINLIKTLTHRALMMCSE